VFVLARRPILGASRSRMSTLCDCRTRTEVRKRFRRQQDVIVLRRCSYLWGFDRARMSLRSKRLTKPRPGLRTGRLSRTGPEMLRAPPCRAYPPAGRGSGQQSCATAQHRGGRAAELWRTVAGRACLRATAAFGRYLPSGTATLNVGFPPATTPPPGQGSEPAAPASPTRDQSTQAPAPREKVSARRIACSIFTTSCSLPPLTKKRRIATRRQSRARARTMVSHLGRTANNWVFPTGPKARSLLATHSCCG